MRLRAQFRTFDDSQGVSIAIGPYTFRPSAKLLHDVANNRRVRLTSKEVAILKLLYRSGVYPADVIVQHQATCVPFNPSTACKPPERGQWTPRYDQSLEGRPRGPPPDARSAGRSVPACHHVDQVAAALLATPPELHQRHNPTAAIHERLQVGIARQAAMPVP